MLYPSASIPSLTQVVYCTGPLLARWVLQANPDNKESNALPLGAAIRRRAYVAFTTRQQAAEGFGPAICSDDPRPVAPGWLMPDMLVVTALELSHPVLLIVLMEADDAALHGCSLVAAVMEAKSLEPTRMVENFGCLYLIEIAQVECILD